MENRLARRIPCILILVLAGSYCFGQIDRAELSGTVKDSTGRRVPSARITAIQTGTGLLRWTVSSSSGLYDIPELPIGLYRVTCSAPGFQAAVFDNLEESVGHTRALDITLAVGGITQQLNGSSLTSQLDETTDTLGARTELEQVRDLPLNGRNWSTLTALAPGAVDTGRSNQRSIRFAGRGLDDNNFTFDGIDATNFVNQAQQSYVRLAIPTDAIQEFRIDTMLFIAENGSTPDGQADVVTAGCTDATSFAANGKHQLVIDWKSDVDPASETVEHYRVQVRNYLGTTGIENGLIAFGTSGTVVHVKASVIVEPIS